MLGAPDPSPHLDFLTGGGDVGRLMRAHDWSTSPLGPPASWPQSLRSVVGLVLNSKFPMFVAWGEELCFVYNDSYAEILGRKHPAALGARFCDIWSEIWSDIAPLIDAAMAGEATYHEDLPLLMNRRGFDEQTWFTFSYSPVRDEQGHVAGMFCAVAETTGKVLAERRAVAERERLERMFEQAPGFMAMLSGPDHRFILLNPAYRRLIGHRDVIGKTVAEALPDAAAQGYVEHLDRCFRTGEALTFTSAPYAMQAIPGGPVEEHLVDFVYQPVRGDDGTVTGVFVEGYDVTERARAEAALRSSEERFREFGEAAADTLWILDAATKRLEYVSPAFERIWGEPRERVLADIERWTEFVHPDDRAAAATALPRLLAGEHVANEYRIVRADGEVRWILDISFPIRDASGHVVRAGGIAQDLTERRLAEDALRRSELSLRDLNETLEQRVADRTRELSESQRRFRGIFDSALQFMALLTPDGTLVEINETALSWSQVTLEDMVGIPFWLAPPMRDNPALQAAVKAGIRRAAAGETVREEHEMRGAGDVHATIDFSLKPVLGDAGEPVFLVAEGRDITALKEAQAGLRQSQKMEAMGQLTGGVAHDFNNLLTPIVGALDTLQRKQLGGEREQRLIDGAIQAAERAKTLVQRLLAFARRQPLQPSTVDLGKLTRGMAELVASTTGPQIKVVVDAPLDLPPAKADPNQLEMALLNLAVNARDSMPDGGTLRISVDAETVGRQHRSGLKPGRYLRLSVADTGIGMDATTVARAIEPFFSTKGVGKGTGLGLSMVHGLASQLGGALAISSTPGLGTNVEFWLPLGERLPVESAPASLADLSTDRRGTVLLVDDEDLIRLSTADMLFELGYTVVEAASAEEAMRLLERGLQPDLLVTDHLMPGISGTDLARAVRASRPATRVLVISGYAETDGIAPDLPRLSKPFRGDELAASLARVTGG